MALNMIQPVRYIKQEPRKRTRYIILHNVNCKLDRDIQQLQFDNGKLQYPLLKEFYIIKDKQIMLPYHYILEKVDQDFMVIMGQPEHYSLKFDDIPDEIDNFSVHIQMMGDFNIEVPNDRLYQTLAYQVISPLIWRYRIPLDNILLHSEVQEDSVDICPGLFFIKDKLMMYVKKYYRSA